eukprot:TRINITY_DN5889_c0_g1_i2.p1 TRINITY_DN5889_c0_g1~~TRINITY_DN5889_c0_g1_i2.p1  ORF type:complete len:119 (-),score=16.37 TRINITY_DN5889_c0_g1_i2:134-490(-)
MYCLVLRDGPRLGNQLLRELVPCCSLFSVMELVSETRRMLLLSTIVLSALCQFSMRLALDRTTRVANVVGFLFFAMGLVMSIFCSVGQTFIYQMYTKDAYEAMGNAPAALFVFPPSTS